MTKLFLVLTLISSMLCAQAPVSVSIPLHRSHKKLWVEVALVAAAVGVTVLVEHEAHKSKPVPAGFSFIPSPISGVNPSIQGSGTASQLFGNPKSPYFIPSYGEPCWMVLIEGKTCGPAWINP